MIAPDASGWNAGGGRAGKAAGLAQVPRGDRRRATPRAASTLPSAAGAPAQRPPAMSEPHPSILFVDDDEANRRSLSWVLRAAGFRPREAASGEEALRLMEERPDLVILDVSLPDIDGFEVC